MDLEVERRSEEPSAIRSFRDRLLRETIAWCVHASPFYRRRFGAAADGFAGLDDLTKLPVLFRDDILAHHRELRCGDELPAYIQYTTGSTGKFLPLVRGAAEARFIGEFFTHQVQSLLASGAVRPLTLALTSAYHGSPTPVPGWPYVVAAGVYDRTQALQAKELLVMEHDLPGVEPRVTTLIGADVLVEALTAFLRAEGMDPRSLAVRQIIVTGGYLTPRRKQLLGEFWGARVQDRYSLSELFGGASECGVGGPWVFDTHVVAEVVHPRTLEPVTRGVGVLLLTGLYPFVQMMPMVRYHTGDLVEVAGRLPGSGDLLVRLMGRERRSVLDVSGSEVVPLLLAGPLYEVIDDLAEVAVTRRFPDLGDSPELELAGKLHYEVSWNLDPVPGARIELRLGLRYPPELHPAKTTALITELRGALYARFPALRNRVASGELELVLAAAPAAQVAPYNAK